MLAHGDPAAARDALRDSDCGTTISTRVVASPVFGIRHPFNVLRATSDGSRLATSPPGGERIAPELAPQTLLFEVVLELLGFLGTLLASMAAPKEKDDDEQEKNTKDNEEDLPPDESSTTATIGWLLCVGVERRDNDGWSAAVVGDHNEFGKADTETRRRARAISTVDIGADTGS